MKKVFFETETEINYESYKKISNDSNRQTTNLYRAIAFILLIFGIFLLFENDYGLKNLGMVFIFLTLNFVRIIFGIGNAIKISWRRLVEKSHTETIKEKIIFYDDELVSTNLTTKLEYSFYYTQFLKFTEFEKYYILTTKEKNVVYIKKDSFIKGEEGEFKEFILGKIKGIKNTENITKAGKDGGKRS